MDRMSQTMNQSTFQPQFKNNLELGEVYNRINAGEDHTVVVVPSLSLCDDSIKNIVGIIHYESRALWEVLKASNPKTNIVFISSVKIKDEALDHLLNLLPNPEDARKRVKLFNLSDSSIEKTLSEKIVAKKELIDILKIYLKNKNAYLKVFISTAYEHKLAGELGIPVLGHDESLDYYLSKSGNKKIFKESNVPFCDSIEDIKSESEMVDAIISLWDQHPDTKKFMVKLDYGVSGIGNAILTAEMSKNDFDKKDLESKKRIVLNWLSSMKFQSPRITWGQFSKDIPRGSIVEIFAKGEIVLSPSAQACINPNKEVEIFSTHDQVLDETGLTFLGSRFPANQNYRDILQENTLQIGETMANLGFIGPFSVDYLITEEESCRRIYVIEINIRQGGTTHPYQTAKLVSAAKYTRESAELTDPFNMPVFYRSNDNVLKPSLKGIEVAEFLKFMKNHDVIYNRENASGVVFHLLGALSSEGKVGYTSIARSASLAEENSNKVLQLIEKFILSKQEKLVHFNKSLA